MSDLDELEALQDGLTSTFWTTFSAYVEQEWGPGGQRFMQAIQATMAGPDDKMALDQLRRVVWTQQEIQKLVKWPSERVAQLRHRVGAELLAARRGGA